MHFSWLVMKNIWGNCLDESNPKVYLTLLYYVLTLTKKKKKHKKHNELHSSIGFCTNHFENTGSRAFQNGQAMAGNCPPPWAVDTKLGSFHKASSQEKPPFVCLPLRDTPIPIPRAMPEAASLDNRNSPPLPCQDGRQEHLHALCSVFHIYPSHGTKKN